MSVEILKDVINHTHEKLGSVVSYISDCDVIVPDYKPDIMNILEVTAYEQINDKNVSRDYVTVSGTINYNILYVSDDEENYINSILYKTPFTNQIPVEGWDGDCNCIVKSNVVHTEYSVHNSRKFNVKCAVDMSADIYKKMQGEIVVSVNDETKLPCKTNLIECYNVCSVNEHTFCVEELCSLSDSDHCSEVVKHSINVTNSEVKVVANKAIVKGDISVKVLYLSDSILKETESEIPFTQLIDLDISENDIIPTAEYFVKNTSVTCELDDDATMSKLKASAEICVILKLFAENRIQYVSDAYSPDFKTDISRTQIVVNGIEDTLSSQCIVSDYLKIKKGDTIEKVLSLDTYTHIEKAEIENCGVKIKGFVNVSLIYNGDNNRVSSVYSQIPYECEVEVNHPVSNNTKCICRVDDHMSSYNIDGTDRVNVREVIKISCQLISENKIDVIDNIEFDETVKTDKTGQAGITVYFVQNGDSMWNIAKRYNTTGEEITAVNKLEKDCTLTAGQQLIIPKHN